VSVGAAPYALDPFGPSANPGAYVACEASERARAALERTLDEGRVAAIVGPPGHGKTLLLRLLGGREEERARVAYVPFCTLDEDDLYAFVLNALGAPPAEGEPRAAVLDLAGSLAARGGIVIIVDDAGAMSDACAASLAALYREGQGSVRIGLAAVAAPDAARVCRAFGDAIDVVHLSEGMSEGEARRYVETRLAYGGARPELVAAFDEETIGSLHRASHGIPRCLNQAAEDIVRRASPGATPRLRELIRMEESAGSGAPPPALPPTLDDSEARGAPHLVVVPDREPPLPSAFIDAPPPPAPSEASLPPADAPPPPDEAVPPPAARLELPPPLVITPKEPRAPVAESEPERTGGILLPHALDEGSGEYRFVEGRPVDPGTGSPLPSSLSAAERAAIASGSGDPPARRLALAQRRSAVERATVASGSGDSTLRRAALAQRRTEELRRKALETPVPQAKPRELPIRALGLIGFAIGVGVAFFWMSESTPRRPAPPPRPSTVTNVQPDAAPITPEPTPPSEANATAPPSSEPTAAATATASVAKPQTIPEPTPAPAAPETPATAAAPIRVSINATPWAVIEVDRRVLGETPLAGVLLTPGVHNFRAIMPDGTTRERAIEIDANNDTVVFQ
jgi:type II secretory pathway predicted ATPase ExeA